MQIIMYFCKASILFILRPSWGTEIAAVEIHIYLCKKTNVGGISLENVVSIRYHFHSSLNRIVLTPSACKNEPAKALQSGGICCIRWNDKTQGIDQYHKIL